MVLLAQFVIWLHGKLSEFHLAMSHSDSDADLFDDEESSAEPVSTIILSVTKFEIEFQKVSRP